MKLSIFTFAFATILTVEALACVFAVLLTVASAKNAAGLATSNFIPARPPAIPIGVKSPYFNTWIYAGPDEGNGGYLAGRWPQFWA